jgi:hypothetical protein
VRYRIVFLSFIMILTGCSSQEPKATQGIPPTKVPQALKVELASQNNLEHWKITVDPRLANKTWGLDLKVEYLQKTPATNVSIQVGGAMASTQRLNPNSPMGFQNIVLGGITVGNPQELIVKLSWQEDGKDINGKAMYDIKPLP